MSAATEAIKNLVIGSKRRGAAETRNTLAAGMNPRTITQDALIDAMWLRKTAR